MKDMKKEIDLLVTGIGELAGVLDGRFQTLSEVSIAVHQGAIVAIGKESELCRRYRPKETVDVEGRAVVPGFVDPHTHVVYAGCRHKELELRLQGKSYLEILEAGGGIMDTVQKTRMASEASLLQVAHQRLDQMLRLGTTTVEIKTGYGLDRENEQKMLRVIQELQGSAKQDLVVTFLGAHVLPPEYRERRDAFVQEVITWLPETRRYASFVDVFMDEGAFTEEETRAILSAAQQQGFRIKLHADELANTGGARVAAEFGAISADHLVHTDDAGIYALKSAGTVPVLLPATSFFLRSSYAPARKMWDQGLPVALATDHNPGTSPTYSMPFVMQLAVFEMGLQPGEALVAATAHAARAIGLEQKLGTLDPGKQADLVVLNAESYVHLVYELGRSLVTAVLKRGEWVYQAEEFPKRSL